MRNKMFFKSKALTFGIIMFHLTGIAIPTTVRPLKTLNDPVRRLQEAYSFCMPPECFVPDKRTQITSANVRCMATQMGLWTDVAGYNPKQVAKFFIKHQQVNEVMTVVDYCNQKYQQTNLDLWAFEAYRCATNGTMGEWLREYMKNVKL